MLYKSPDARNLQAIKFYFILKSDQTVFQLVTFDLVGKNLRFDFIVKHVHLAPFRHTV